MNRVTHVITNGILRGEKNLFIFRVIFTVIAYVGITFWFVWLLIGIRISLFLTIFVVCSLRLRQCRKPTWWLLLPLLLSRINNWEIVAIPATIIMTLILSELNMNVSKEREHLVPADKDAAGTPSEPA